MKIAIALGYGNAIGLACRKMAISEDLLSPLVTLGLWFLINAVTLSAFFLGGERRGEKLEPGKNGDGIDG